MHKILCLSFCLIGYASYGQIEEVRRITKTLCSPEFHGRGYVNRGDSIAAEFLATEFKNLGLKPLKKSYFQSFHHDVNTFPTVMEVRMGDEILKPGIDFLVDPSSGGGKTILNPKTIEIETLLNKEKLATAFQEILKSKEFNAVLIDLTKLSNDTLKKIGGISQELAKYVPVIEITNKKFTWSVADAQLGNPIIQIQESKFIYGQKIAIDIDAKLIHQYHSRNVIAMLPAKKKCKKTLFFTAHYDHLGRMGTDTYFPGGNDNASGTAMLLSMAKYFKENPVDYNIVFIAFAGEEAGLVGSKYFTEHPLMKLSKINFLINLDIMGSGEEGITVVNATLFEEEFKLLQKINTDYNLLAQVKSRGPAANSDHYWFTEKGVPAFFIYTMGPNKNYHDVFDTYENLSFNEYEDITTLLVNFVEQLKK